MSNIRRVIILGSTGSIGTQTLEVVSHLNALHERGVFPVRHEVVGLAAGRNEALLREQAATFGVRRTALSGDAAMSHSCTTSAHSLSESTADASHYSGSCAATELVRHVLCDVVVAAMVGSAGLPATMAAAELGRDVALANKETLVAAGGLVVAAARKSGSRLLPVDSEHSALWQCLATPLPPPFEAPVSLTRAILTASGGPFRTWTKAQIAEATPEQAMKHPTWSMGRKVTVDSASLLNKALEIIEAHWLFSIPGEKIEALVHPQSMVHAMAEFADGNVMAQVATPDMKLPIQHALTWPSRVEGVAKRVDWTKLKSLEFEAVDHERFPLFRLGHRAIAAGGTAGAILNAANEAAVEAFLAPGSMMRFGRMVELVLDAVESVKPGPMKNLADCTDAQERAKDHVKRMLAK